MGRLISRRNNLNFFDSVDVRELGLSWKSMISVLRKISKNNLTPESTRNIIRHVEEGSTKRMNRATKMKEKRKESITERNKPRPSIMMDALEFF